MAEHATKTDGVWRIMRFENAAGKWAEVASNQVGPEAIPVPAGYRFVSSTPMVAAVDLDQAQAENEQLRKVAVEAAVRLIDANHKARDAAGSPLGSDEEEVTT